jgi:hypothetical protein
MNIQNFVQKYPYLYHMAEANTWESIRDNGLLSTTAILDYHGVSGVDREAYEFLHRPKMMEVSSTAHQLMVLRDQIPMPPNRMAIGLRNGITPSDWYFFLNQKVFFWATRERLMTLLNARHYRNVEHDVLTVDTASFINDYANRVSICHMNSGNTFPIPHMRDYSIFTSIDAYPTKANGDPIKEVAEVTINYSVPDIHNYTIKVERIVGNTNPVIIYER